MRKICYSKLWKLLIDKKMNGSELRKAVEMAPNTLTKLYKEEGFYGNYSAFANISTAI